MEENQIPRNCMECDNRYSCFRSWYGNGLCKYQKEIHQAVIREVSSIEGGSESEQQLPCNLHKDLP